MDQEILRVFFSDVLLECSLLRWRRTAVKRRFVCLHLMNVDQLQLSSSNSAPNSGNNRHLTIPFEGGMHSFKRQSACVKGKDLVGCLWQKSNWSMSDRRSYGVLENQLKRQQRTPLTYVTKTWSDVLLNKKDIYPYLKCFLYDKLLKPRQSFRITLYNAASERPFMTIGEGWWL